MDVSLIIPVYNEEDRLPSTIDTVIEYVDASRLSMELILVNDGSSDGTGSIIEAAAGRKDWISAVLCETNRGKGAAVREGFAKARGEAVVFFDADLSYPLDLIEVAADRIREGADLVIGGRDLTGKDSRWRYSPVRRMATIGFNVLVEQLLSLGIPDTQCGFKAFRRDVTAAMFEKLTIDSFAFDIELLYLARIWSLRIDRIPVNMKHDRESSIRLFRDSLKMLRDIMEVRRRADRGFYGKRPPGLKSG